MLFKIETQFNQSNKKKSDKYKNVALDAFDKRKKLNNITVTMLLRLNSKGTITILGSSQFSFLADGDKNGIEKGKKLFKNNKI